MKYFLLNIIIFPLSLLALDMDPAVLEEIIQNNPDAQKEKLLLAKYYAQHNNDIKASVLLEDILKNDKNNKNALLLKQNIEKKEYNREIFKKAALTQPVQSDDAEKRLDTYYNENNYQAYTLLYQALNDTDISIKNKYHIQAAYIYLWNAQYNKSKKALDKVEDKTNLDVAKIQADIYYYTGKYDSAASLFEKLYQSTYTFDYAFKLINCYLYTNNSDKAKKLYNYLIRKYPTNKKLQQLSQTFQNQEQNNYLQLKENFEKNPNFTTLQAYTVALNERGKLNLSQELLNHYNQENASVDSLLLEAKYLLWGNKTEQSLKILQRDMLKENLEAKLMIGQIYSWNQKFAEAKKALKSVLDNSSDKELLYQANKALAFVYMWNKQPKEAKEIFQKLHQENNSDLEVKEALFELNNDKKNLLKIYERRVQKKSNMQDIKRLADLYIQNNQNEKALILLKKYLNKNPHDLQTTKDVALMLINKKDYYQGFGYLEYYNAQTNTLQSHLLLAKNYYWSGFSKEALDVLDKTVSLYPQSKEALELKAKILKISPRFTTSNSGATIQTYFDNITSTQLQLADSLYFNNHYQASLMYYEAYILQHPQDHNVRYRYAFALENSQKYAKAAGEFSLVFWAKDSDELRYHYAYNLMKSNKLKEAKKLLLQLKEKSFDTIAPKLEKFLTEWKNAWQSQDYNRYKKFYAHSFENNSLWAFKKQQTFKSSKYIAVSVYEPVYKESADNNYIVKFYQEYETDKKHDKGYKTLHIKCDKTLRECKITKETWSAGKYKKERLLMPYIDNALKEIQRLQHNTFSYNKSKKKILINNKNLTYITV